jgi:hypothetical protein
LIHLSRNTPGTAKNRPAGNHTADDTKLRMQAQLMRIFSACVQRRGGTYANMVQVVFLLETSAASKGIAGKLE